MICILVDYYTLARGIRCIIPRRLHTLQVTYPHNANPKPDYTIADLVSRGRHKILCQLQMHFSLPLSIPQNLIRYVIMGIECKTKRNEAIYARI